MDFVESITLELPQIQPRLAEFSEGVATKGLIIELAAIHEGLTANYNMYSAAELEKSLDSWVEPYPKPIIKNHDIETEPLGRVMAARMDKEADGAPFVRLQVRIDDATAIEKIMDQRYLTGSVGGKAGEALCSVCGKDWANSSMFELPCRHERGKVYKGKLAYFEMKNIGFKEYSFVNAPADQRSSIRTTGGEGAEGDGWVRATESEGERITRAHFFAIDMNTESVVEMSESGDRNVLGEMKRKDGQLFYHVLRGSFLTSLPEENAMPEENEDDVLAVIESLEEPAKADEDETPEPEADETPEDAPEDEPKEEDPEAPAAEDPKPEDTPEDEPTPEEGVGKPEANEKPHTEDTPPPVEREGDEDPEDAKPEEEPAPADDATADASTADERISDLASEVARLSEENTKLRTFAKRGLAERVVDTRIALGLSEKDQRDTLVEEYTTRTASSLRDSISDLAAMKPVVSNVESDMDSLEMSPSVAAVGEDEKEAITSEEQETQEKPVDPNDRFVETLTDAMMWRKKIS